MSLHQPQENGNGNSIKLYEHSEQARALNFHSQRLLHRRNSEEFPPSFRVMALGSVASRVLVHESPCF